MCLTHSARSPQRVCRVYVCACVCQAELESERAGRAADKAKARENQTLLAKEVKKLRGELATAQQVREAQTHTHIHTGTHTGAPIRFCMCVYANAEARPALS